MVCLNLSVIKTVYKNKNLKSSVKIVNTANKNIVCLQTKLFLLELLTVYLKDKKVFLLLKRCKYNT